MMDVVARETKVGRNVLNVLRETPEQVVRVIRLHGSAIVCKLSLSGKMIWRRNTYSPQSTLPNQNTELSQNHLLLLIPSDSNQTKRIG